MKRVPECASAEELGVDPRVSCCLFFSFVSLITDYSQVLFQMFLFQSTFKYRMFFFFSPSFVLHHIKEAPVCVSGMVDSYSCKG